MLSGDYVMTIDSDDEVPIQSIKPKDEVVQLDMDFAFDPSVDVLADTWNDTLGLRDLIKTGSKPVRMPPVLVCLMYALSSQNTQVPISVDDIITRRKQHLASKKRKRTLVEGDEEDDGQPSDSGVGLGGREGGSESDESEFAGFEAEDADDPLASSDEEREDAEGIQSDGDEGGEDEGLSDSSEELDGDETQVEKDRKMAFFADNTGPSEQHDSFLSMNLSRPVLKALTSLAFATPTPIQAATIPVALLGKDVVGNAVTGSGKTAAFIIPMIERLLYRERGKKAAATRCLILVPTRELGVQCYEVGKKLSAHTDIRFCLAVGTFF